MAARRGRIPSAPDPHTAALLNEPGGEQLLRLLAKLAPVGIFLTDIQGDCRFANERWCEFAGLTPEQAMGEGWIAALHPEDRERVAQAWVQAVGSGSEFQAEYRFQRPDGRVTWLAGIAIALHDDAGDVTGYLGVATDITRRKHIEDELAQARLRFDLVAKATNDAIWDWNLLTDDVWWNDGITTLFGYLRTEVESTAAWWIEHIHPDDREGITSSIYAAINGGRRTWSAEYRYRCQDGTYARVFDRGYVVHEHGKAVRMIGCMVDLTGRIETEEELRMTNERLKDVNSVMMGREERVLELKREVNDLLFQLGEPARYGE